MDPKERNRFTKDLPIPIVFSPTQKLLNLIANLAPHDLKHAAVEAGLFIEGEDEKNLFPARLVTRAQHEGKQSLLWDAAAVLADKPAANPFRQ